MDTKKLERWAGLLLDTGKRNNLINFKDTKASTVEVVAPDSQTLLAKAESNAAFEVLDVTRLDVMPKTAAKSPRITETLQLVTSGWTSFADGTGDGNAQADTMEMLGDERFKPKSIGEEMQPVVSGGTGKTVRQQYIDTYAPMLRKAGQVLLYSSTYDPVKALYNIGRKARLAVEETGVNTAYIAIGFVHWKEKDEENFYRAPLLLSPVLISRKSAVDPMVIRMTEDDVVVNPTLAFKMEREYGIELPAYEGESLPEYLEKVTGLIAPLGWKTTDESKIGIFSFLKINMYRDLMTNADLILQNTNIRRLLNEEIDEEPETAQTDGMDETDPVMDLKTVVDADSSQIEAVLMSRTGRSFVLQGPPGTGKSQTITNIIAQAMADGRKVLFVSEKLAALNVVYEKLRQAGLDEFCLELHSHKANKKTLIDDLCKTMRLPRYGVSESADRVLEEKHANIAALNGYERILHRERTVIETSLYRMIEEYTALPDIETTDLPFRNIKELGRDHLSEMEKWLHEYALLTPFLGEDYRENAWYGLNLRNSALQTEGGIPALVRRMAEECEALSPVLQDLKDCFGISVNNLEEAHALQAYLAFAVNAHYLTPALIAHMENLVPELPRPAGGYGPAGYGGQAAPARKAVADLRADMGSSNPYERLLSLIDNLEWTGNVVVSVAAQIAEDYTLDVYRLDAEGLLKELRTRFSNPITRLFSSRYKEIVREIGKYGKRGPKQTYEQACGILGKLESHHQFLAMFDKSQKALEPYWGKAFSGVTTDWAALRMELLNYYRLQEGRLPDLGGIKELRDHYDENGIAAAEAALTGVMTAFGQTEQALCDNFDSALTDLRKLSVKELRNRMQGCIEQENNLENACHMGRILDRIKALGEWASWEKLLDLGVVSDKMPFTYRKAFYGKWIREILGEAAGEENGLLPRTIHDHNVQQFVENDRLQFQISKAQICADLSDNRPSLDLLAPGSAVSLLLREGEKKRKQKSIRRILAETGELVQRIKPCFLMSPLSVSTFLTADAVHFDLVIFDEASQIFPQDAVGAIYRGTQLIVVGDSRQMPPSNFFRSMAEEEKEEDEAGDVADFESILDICSATMTQLRLRWHYRSRYEQLIAFSNTNFYEGELVTFPSPVNDRKDIGVDYYYVDGTYRHHARYNRKEAEFIADLVWRDAKLYPNRSLGVVAFSISQQEIIEQILEERRQADPSMEWFFDMDREEPFFVKNLETVQGDERDTIIFSIAYAKDERGVLLHNFGPLNREGGERRLNVAVTRAKQNVQVVSSIHGSDIDLNKTHSLGAKLLKEYLSYAEHGGMWTEPGEQKETLPFAVGGSTTESSSAVLGRICEFLEENGYEAVRGVGCTASRVEIGVRRPGESDFFLAVEGDGAGYSSFRNTRDRDRLRREILERMGWKHYRVWTADWYRNFDTERIRLLEAVKAAEPGNGDKKPEVETEGLQEAVTEMLPHSEISASVEFAEKDVPVIHTDIFPEYRQADVCEICSRHLNLLDAVKEILEIEAPLSEEWLLKRVVFWFGKEKVTKTVQQEFERRMIGYLRYGIIRRDGFLYLEGQQEYQLRVPGADEKRDLKYIATEELAAGLYTLLLQNVKADKQDLYRTLAKALGFARFGEGAELNFERALRSLGDKVRVSGEQVSLAD